MYNLQSVTLMRQDYNVILLDTFLTKDLCKVDRENIMRSLVGIF